MRKQTRVKVFDRDGEWPPTYATECVSWFAEKLASIPDEHKAAAKIEFGSESGYEGDHYVRIQIYYVRPETDDEIAAREAEERRRQEEWKDQELRTLAALKEKYGS